jgi:hypothetical protein
MIGSHLAASFGEGYVFCFEGTFCKKEKWVASKLRTLDLTGGLEEDLKAYYLRMRWSYPNTSTWYDVEEWVERGWGGGQIVY